MTLTRRTLLSTGGALLTGLAGSAALSGCSVGKEAATSTGASGSASSAAPTPAKSIAWAQWPDYIDSVDRRRPSLDAFTKRTGIAVEYLEVINDNQEYIDSIAGPLEREEPIGADLVTLTNWAAAGLVRAGQVQALGTLTNANRLLTALTRPDWDPEQKFSMPWQAGLTGIAYDSRRVDRAIGSISELLSRPDLRGRVGVLTELADSVGMVMLADGAPVTAGQPNDVANGIGRLEQLNSDGWFAGWYGNDVMRAFRKGQVDAALAWSGDILQAQANNPYLKFVVPEEGLMIWSDNLMIPAGATPEAAAAATQLIDFYYQPEVAAQVAAYVQYICPVAGAQEALAVSNADLASNPLVFPDASILDVAYQFPTLPEVEDADLRERFAALVG